MKAKWEERYGAEDYAYGTSPNEFFRAQLDQLKPGKILLPAEGEGRNAAYAAEKGWDVSAFDQSENGQQKALQLAQAKHVKINYDVYDSVPLPYPPASFDAVGLIYSHFGPEHSSAFNRHFAELLKPGGLVILECFSKKHLAYNSQNPAVGGPKDEAFLFSEEEIRADFPNFEPLLLAEEEIELKEGKFHIGRGMVIRFVGRKKG